MIFFQIYGLYGNKFLFKYLFNHGVSNVNYSVLSGEMDSD